MLSERGTSVIQKFSGASPVQARVDGRRAYHRAGFLDIYADDEEPEEREANYHYGCLTIRRGVGWEGVSQLS